MYRVLRLAGTALFGIISTDSWPPSAYGEGGAPGEYWAAEDGERVCHAIFADEEADRLAANWETALQWKVTLVLGERAEEATEKRRRALRGEAPELIPEAAWMAVHSSRHRPLRYVHSHDYVRKPEE